MRTLVYFQSVKTKEYLVALIDGCILSSDKICDALLLYEGQARHMKTNILTDDRTDVWVWREVVLKRNTIRAPRSKRKLR